MINEQLATIVLHTGEENWLRERDLEDISEFLRQCDNNPRISIVVLESASAGVFSFGCDVRNSANEVDPEPLLRAFVRVADQLLTTRLLTVAKVDGYCLGGGFELVLLCGLAYASERSIFRFPEILLGCAPPIAAAIYPTIVGSHVALDHLLSAKKITAQDARENGILADWFPTEKFDLQFSDRIQSLLEGLRQPETFESIRKCIATGEQQQFLSGYRILRNSPSKHPPHSSKEDILHAVSRIAKLRMHFIRRLRSALEGYQELANRGVIDRGVAEYWKRRKQPVQKSDHSFSLDWLGSEFINSIDTSKPG